ncbi:unnamed protein product [Brachionus calyciflorus]|uniref:Uncharacterized protein n=1 Tax=Brachionus calyciflorus TaxID=104777 RepID=A0A813U897_9BILA|nr:unnamed protein product [Brachionus calyciflorus]
MISQTLANISSRPLTAPHQQQQPIYQYVPLLNREKTENNEMIWRDQVRNQLETSNRQVDRSDAHIYVSKRDDPLTNLREVLRNLSNSEAFRYMKQCRLIVAKLKKCWVDVNEEIKSLSKNKEYLESALDHIRKDLIINKETSDNRLHRPATEPNEDKVDDTLEFEKQTLLSLKRNLENILKPVQEHLYKLDELRERVHKLGKERSAVTDLICQCLTQSMRSFDKAMANNKNNNQSSNAKLFKSQSTLFNNDNLIEASQASFIHIGPLSAFTNESVDIIREADAQIQEGRDLRGRSRVLMRDSIESAKQCNLIVNDQFLRKIEDTLLLSKHLNVSSSENRLAQNRAIRWQDLNNISHKYTLGPEKSTNLFTYERLDRPIASNFQRHPGNQLPEAQEISKGSDLLSNSLLKSEQHIRTLKVIGKKMDQNAKEKEFQHSLDTTLLRRRRELSDHRWVPEKYVKK